MVSRITVGYPTDDKGRPYRRRRARPAIIVAVILLVAGVIAWAVALSTSTADATPTSCNQYPGQFLGRSTPGRHGSCRGLGEDTEAHRR